MKERPLFYTRPEVESFLPSGWTLAADEIAGRWNAEREAWSATVLDGVDFAWTLEVKAAAAQRDGRREALQAAFDDLYRERLGRPTRGLGMSKGA